MPIINPININDFSNGKLVHNQTTATLTSAGWTSETEGTMQTISVPNMTSTATVFVAPQYNATTNYAEYYATDKIILAHQSSGELTFRRYSNSSSGDIAINVIWFEPGSTGSQVVILNENGWVAGEQTILIPSISLSTYVWISPTDSDTDMENYVNSQIYCSEQNDGSLTFSYAGTTPTASIPVNVVWEDMTASSLYSRGVNVFGASDTIDNIYTSFISGRPTYIFYNNRMIPVGNVNYDSGSEWYQISAIGTYYYSLNQIDFYGFVDKEVESGRLVSGLATVTKTLS